LTVPTNIFADDTQDLRVAAIKRRLTALERNPVFGQQREYARWTGAFTLGPTFTRANLAPVSVYVPEGAARLRFSAVGGLDYAGVQSGGLEWSVYNVNEPLDDIYTPGTFVSRGDAVDNYATTNRPLFGNGTLSEYRPNVVGEQIYAIDARYITGSPVANVDIVSFNIEVI